MFMIREKDDGELKLMSWCGENGCEDAPSESWDLKKFERFENVSSCEGSSLG